MSELEPRRGVKYNLLLPYAKQLDEEAENLLAEIKLRIAQCLDRAEIRPGLVSWIFHLQSFIGLHGFKFSKEEHVELIKLLLDVVIMPGLDVGTVQRVASTLCRLLKPVTDFDEQKEVNLSYDYRKKYLLSPSDLTIEWRDLFNMMDRCFSPSLEYHGLIQFPQSLESQIHSLIRMCRPYFPKEATKEMLDEWLLDMCPFDEMQEVIVRRFTLFLPTTLPPEQFEYGWKLWFDRFMSHWRLDRRGSCETVLVGLFARLAEDNVGYIDWEPYLPDIFTRLLRSFNLPYGSGNIKVLRSTSSSTLESSQLARWVVATLGGGSATQAHLEQLFTTLESFYHPSNHGRWTVKLTRFLGKLAEQFVDRIWLERYKGPSWLTPVPEEKKISEADIDAFVDMVKPIALISMFSKAGSAYSSTALQSVAWLRPAKVIPPLLERLNEALYSLTEPHRLTATLTSVGFVSRCLALNHSKLGVPVNIPALLMACLPGIDSNDLRKTTVTFQLISTIVTLVPLVDCSSLADTAPQEYQESCMTTAIFEDFVLELLSRCFCLVENAVAESSSHQREKSSVDENILEVGLASTFTAVFNQCSPQLYQSALDKLHGFVNNKILDKISGKLAATICQCAVRANPELGLKRFLPHFCKLALALLEPEEVLKDEKVDNELHFSLVLLAEIVRCNAKHVQTHLPMLVRVLKRALQLNARNGYIAASLLLKNTLRVLVAVYPLEFKSSLPLEPPTLERLHVEHWGESEDINEVEVKWHVPSDEDIVCAKMLYEECVEPQLQQLRKWCSGPQDQPMTKEEVQRSLTVVYDTMQGLGTSLPALKGEAINVIGTETPIFCRRIINIGTKTFSETLRKDIMVDIKNVMETVFKVYEDDIKSLNLITRIFGTLVFFFGVPKNQFELRYKGYKHTKAILDLKLSKGAVKHIRSLIVDRAQLQHELRLMQVCQQFTEHHVTILQCVFRLGTSHYAGVRCLAQDVMNSFFSVFPRSYRFVMDEMCGLLVDPDMSHDQYKGILYTLLGNKDHNIITINNWSAMSQLWPAIVSAQHSEKPSIIALINKVQEQVVKYMETYPIVTKVPLTIVRKAALLADGMDVDEQDELRVKGEKNLDVYEKLVLSLTELINGGELHWRHHYLALVMIKMLLRHDVAYGEKTVALITSHLVSDHLRTRKICIDMLAAVLKQQKRKHPKVKLERSEIEELNDEVPLNPIFEKCLEGKKRPFNLFLQLNSANYPDTEEKWEKSVFVHRTHVGYSGIKEKFEVYAKDTEQPGFPRTEKEMSPAEFTIYSSFSDQAFVKKFVFYLAIEEHKGRDKFDGRRVALFKGLFRNYGDGFLQNFEEFMKTFLIEGRQESEQRCALEILAGLVRGAKHWPFELNERLSKFVVPLIESGINNMMQETMVDWGTCVATIAEDRDCSKFYWFFETLSRDVFGGSPFVQGCKLYMLLGGLVQLEWRVQELAHRLLQDVTPNLAHPYLNVRERIAHLLANIFAFGRRVNDGEPTPFLHEDNFTLSPNSLTFLAEVMGSLSMLKQENHEQEKEQAKRMFQTLLKWQASHVAQSYACVLPQEALLLIPAACHLIADTTNEELQKDCGILFAILGYELLSNKTLHAALACVHLNLFEPSWKVRNFVTSLLLFVTYSNLFMISADPKLRSDVREVVFRLISDERVEVRVTAQEALSGLIHCGLLEVTDEVLLEVKNKLQKVSKKLRKHRQRVKQETERRRSISGASKTDSDPISEADQADENKMIIEYHSEVLILCACINAYPYDVPQFMPDVICVLAGHVNAPQPIPTTIKKTLSDFKRTHHDSWRDHKEKFSEEQLTVITDLLVSPSYYA